MKSSTHVPLAYLSSLDLTTTADIYFEGSAGEILPITRFADDLMGILSDLVDDMRSTLNNVVNDYEVDSLIAYAADLKKVKSAIDDGYTHVFVDARPSCSPIFDPNAVYDDEDDGLPF